MLQVSAEFVSRKSKNLMRLSEGILTSINELKNGHKKVKEKGK